MTSERDQQPWPHVVVRAPARRWVRWLVVLGTVVSLGTAALLTDMVASGIPTSIAGALVLVAFAGVVVCLAAITVRWRTSVRSDGESLVLRDPLGARVVPLSAELGFVRWLDGRTHRPVLWLVERGSLVAPLSPLLSPLQLEGFALALGIPVTDIDGPPTRRGTADPPTPSVH
ncbi:hypothetical protein [Microcella sp.]|uniref:hypothetical protein n=1 Tax=Microcella sp. TaxID=1913979 RepID=UPI002565E2C0|nr:hypothetical protein [Microcella sp.]MBX9470587.1 hypothetical protein [Microcella sp.]